MEKYIYFVISKSKTFPARVIRVRSFVNFYDRREKDLYTHASLSFNSSLTNMRSFARRSKWNLFNAGLVEENIKKSAFSNGVIKDIIVFKVPINSKKYNEIRKVVNNYWKNKEGYKYNVLGLIYLLFTTKGIKRKSNKYFCSEWIATVLDEANMEIFRNIKNKDVRPSDFYDFLKEYKIYEGHVSGYNNKYARIG